MPEMECRHARVPEQNVATAHNAVSAAARAALTA